MKSPLIIGTRGSDLALWQAHFIQNQLLHFGIATDITIIKTQGDEIQHLSLDKLEGKGFFTKEIEEALLQEKIDLAIHSHKDLETEQPFGLTIAAVSHRADPRELLLIHPSALNENLKYSFKEGAVFGTSSSRRKSQMLTHRPDIQLKDIRGNVPTRVQKLRDGNYDAILLAKAGVDRLELDLSDLICIPLDADEFIPAPAQGVLAVQCRANDNALIEALQSINDKEVAVTTELERSVLRMMKGGCHLPLGVFATKEDGEFTVQVSYAPEWSSPSRFLTFVADDSLALPQLIVDELNKEK